MTKPSFFVRSVISALLSLVLLALAGGAQAEPALIRVLIVSTDPTGPVAARLEAELGANGFVAEHMAPEDDVDLATLANTAGTSAAVRVIHGGPAVEVWAARSGEHQAEPLREVLEPTASADEPETVVAVRAVELLRASLVPVEATPTPPDRAEEPEEAGTPTEEEARPTGMLSHYELPPEQNEESERRDPMRFALLFSPDAHLLTPLLSQIAIVRPELKFPLSGGFVLELTPAFAYYFGNPEIDLAGGGGTVGFRLVPGGGGLAGFHFTPQVGALYVHGKSATRDLDATQVVPTGALGYGWVFGHFVMDLRFGAGYAFTVQGYDVNQDSSLGGFVLIANYALGFGF
ncbi:MAG: hypothetical protein R3B72_19670 [Polyangiaceae bacterium]